MFAYRKATLADLEKIWNMNIADHPGDARWVRWKREYIAYNQKGMAATYVVCCNDQPVGEGTLIFSPECKAAAGRTELADGKTIANVNALRIRKEFEGRGHISRLMKLMERTAAEQGITCLTIGVEAKESRNLGIYLHWGYDRFVCSEVDEGELVLYYAKRLV